jgi:hypothetical protein
MWTWNEHAFDPDLGQVVLLGQRIQFESAVNRPALGFTQVTVCEVVPAALTIATVASAILQPTYTRSPRGLRFELAEATDLELTLHFDGGRIKATLASSAGLTLSDRGPPIPGVKHRYWGRRYHDALSALAIEARLRAVET